MLLFNNKPVRTYQMEIMKSETSTRDGSIEASHVLFDEMPPSEKFYHEMSMLVHKKEMSLKDRHLEILRREIDRLRKHKLIAEKDTIPAKSELMEAKKVAEELASSIEKTKVTMNGRNREQQTSTLHAEVREEIDNLMVLGRQDRYSDVMTELEIMKRKIGNVKLDMHSALEAKAKAENDVKASRTRINTCSKYIGELGKEIDEADEERALVELARAEAIKEFKRIGLQREADAARFVQKLKEAKAEAKKLRKKINHAKKLEKKLAITNSDLTVLRTEMDNIRTVERNSRERPVFDKREERTNESVISSFHAAEGDLDVARKELASIKEEGFKRMASIDVLRGKMERIASRKEDLKKAEEKADVQVRKLNTDLMRSKFELDLASGVEQQAQGKVSDLIAALHDLLSEKEMSVKEKEKTLQEIETCRRGMERNESIIGSTKERLIMAMHELEQIKLSETVAMDSLKILSEKASNSRGLRARDESTITMTSFEYEYLQSSASGARELAYKKVEAAKAWAESIDLSEKEILLQAETAKSAIRELGGFDVRKIKANHGEKSSRRGSISKSRAPKVQLAAMTRRSLVEDGRAVSSRKTTGSRKPPTSVGIDHVPSSGVRRRRTAMVRLVKFLGGRSG